MFHKSYTAATAQTHMGPASNADTFVPETPLQLPLPGVIIFVHGVNSMGEWYEAGESGLCEGLNQRMARTPDKMTHGNVAGGCMRPNNYQPEIDENGQLIDTTAKRFFSTVDNYSPVIRFRWGFRCAPGQNGLEEAKTDPTSELSQFETEIMLNKDDAWGGGPFQNGTSCLSDLWGPGLTDRMFWFFNTQQFNATARTVFRCPQRHYMVHAAQRLADLIADIRATQPSCPITVICHSQGNMIGTAAALLAKSDDLAADNYVLCNPPYSLEHIETYSLGDAGVKSVKEMASPLSTRTAAQRITTFDNFLKRIQQRGELAKGQQPLCNINDRIANQQQEKTYFKLADSADYDNGIDRDNRGNVFLYANPQDQVIGVSTIQGIGWKGVTAQQLSQLNKNFYQRIWAQGIAIGDPKRTQYHYWDDHWNKEAAKRDKFDFWHPRAPRMHYRLTNGRYDQNIVQSAVGWIVQIGAVITGALDALRVIKLDSTQWILINGLPDPNHVVPVNAPPLPKNDGGYLLPRSRRAGESVTRGETTIAHSEFDEGADASNLAVLRQKEDSAERRDMRMEQNAMIRINNAQNKAKRWYHLGGESRSDAQYESWFKAEPQNATDHSTILLNPEHATRALAYDVAIGLAMIPKEKWAAWRRKAHWRFAFPEEDPYYTKGVAGDRAKGSDENSIEGSSVGKALQDSYPPQHMPDTIVDGPQRPQEAFALHSIPRGSDFA